MTPRQQHAEWVQQQHKTMLRWVNLKLGTAFTDLSRDLRDGLALIQLINTVITEMDVDSTDLKLYFLQPLYTKPRIELQRLENVSDFLEFIRIVLRINTTGISSDNIVGGNLKLILGLIWSIFIFSTSTSIGVMNDGNSITQIKLILLNWVNSSFKLQKITNFNRDWSLEVNSPDTILHSILKCYLPSAQIPKLTESAHKNLKIIIDYAESLGINKLAEVDDFTSLVPDEKCTLFYLIEWYKFFEFGTFEKPQLTYDTVIVKLVAVIKLKYEYETKSLRLSNKMNTVSKSIRAVLDLDASPLCTALDRTEAMGDEEAAYLRQQMENVLARQKSHEEMTHLTLKLHKDLRELHSIKEELAHQLSLIDENLDIAVTKNLQLENLRLRLASISNSNARDLILAFNKEVLEHPAIKKAQELDVAAFARKIDYFSRNFAATPTLQVLESRESREKGEEREREGEGESVQKQYRTFKSQMLKLEDVNEPELKLILHELTSYNLSESYIKSFIDCVPTKIFMGLNDSDFSLALESDDDSEIDTSKLIFEDQRQRVSSQLSTDKVFDFEAFFSKFEHGLKF